MRTARDSSLPWIKMAGSLQTLTFHRPFTSHNHVSLHLRPNHPSYLLRYASNSVVYSPDNVSLHQNPRSISHISKASNESNQVGDNGNQQSRSWDSSKGVTWTQPLLKFAATNFLPIVLVSGVALGLVNPSLGCLAHRYSMSKFSTFGIFLISGLTLRTEEIGAAAEAWHTGLFGLISILLLSPFFSKLILHLQLAPQEFVTGLAIFSCMPTTLSSGVALTQLVGGNSALALAMTVISNLLGILILAGYLMGHGDVIQALCLVRAMMHKHFYLGCVSVSNTYWTPTLLGNSPVCILYGELRVRKTFVHEGQDRTPRHNVFSIFGDVYRLEQVPFSLSKFIANGVGVSVPTEQLLRSLLITLLVPLVLGKVFRDCFGGVAKYVDQNRKLFSMSSAVLLSLVPWIQVSKSRPLLLMVKPTMFLVAAGMGMLLHITLLACNTSAALSLSVTFGKNSSFSNKKNFRALVIVASQKTLPVMVAVVEQLRGALGESGLLVLPCVAAHIIQIILDSFLVNFWLQKDQVIKGNMKA